MTPAHKALSSRAAAPRAAPRRVGKTKACPRPLWWRFLIFACRNSTSH